jgi:hydrogenase maturation protein HypF
MLRTSDADEYCCISVTGRVQGVGFRPYIYRLATSLNLRGWVKNTAAGVEIYLSGSQAGIQHFHERVLIDSPAAAKIATLERQTRTDFTPSKDFQIRESDNSPLSKHAPEVSPDIAICARCTSELFTPDNRRHLHPFISCTDCGPRYSIISDLPYDRVNTSMAKFPMCPGCQTEFSSPADRRFHSQTNACHHCGPKLSLDDKQGKAVTLQQGQSPIEFCAQRITQGDIIAVKGIGGFHLICDANNSNSISRLRKIKQRPDKPLAIMALNSASLESWVKLDDACLEALNSSMAPIVLCPKSGEIDDPIAPGLNTFACMLPYTPIHYLLFYALLDNPEGMQWLSQAHQTRLLVTSANHPGEPIIYDHSIELQQVHQLADYVLSHDREIIAPTDDSLVQPGKPSTLIRRARGFAPASILLPGKNKAVIACGAHLKNTFCLKQGSKAYLSPHIGELESPERLERYDSTLAHYQHLFGKHSDRISVDLHPDYASTHIGEARAHQTGLPLNKVQHHHAHLASVMAEQHDIKAKTTLGLILDGHGLGEGNDAWGGELFCASQAKIKRIGHLEKIAIPGGDIATRQIWRIGANLLSVLNQDSMLDQYATQLNSPMTRDFILNGKHTQTSSAGRWFDAIASIINLRQHCTYEGQAAAELESLAQPISPASLALINKENQLLLSPLLPSLLSAKNKKQAASIFHAELIDGLIRWLSKAADTYNTKTVCCSGGCFQNKLLRESLHSELRARGFEVYFNQNVPANDGGISLGQAYLAANNYG